MSNRLEHIQGLHLELTNICTLKCPGCARTQFINQFGQHWKNHNLNLDDLKKFIDVDLVGKTIIMCGNYGDPIYHPEFLLIVEFFKQQGCNVSIITNGSYKNHAWWKQLTEQLTEKDQITFSIDGIPENFFQYRINADWDSIQVGLEVVGSADCHSIWKYIPFRFNQENINQAQELSKKFGIKEFQLERSDRFDSNTQHLVPDPDLLGPRYQAQIVWKDRQTSQGLDPKCYDGRQHFITATGHYSPCCFFADHRFYYKSEFGKQKNHYSIQNHTLSQILSRQETLNILDNLDNQSCCQYNCPAG